MSSSPSGYIFFGAMVSDPEDSLDQFDYDDLEELGFKQISLGYGDDCTDDDDNIIMGFTLSDLCISNSDKAEYYTSISSLPIPTEEQISKLHAFIKNHKLVMQEDELGYFLTAESI